MKIKIISPAYPYRGGISNFTNSLYKSLSESYDVDIINFSRQYPAILFPGKSQFEDNNTAMDIPSKRSIDSINPFTWLKVGKELCREAPDVVVFAYWMPFFAPAFGMIARQIKKNRKTKIVTLCHNIIPHEKTVVDEKLTQYFFNKVDKFIVLSDAVKNDLLSIHKNADYTLLFHPVYSNYGEPVDKVIAKEKLSITSERIILFFGFIRDYKGLDTLLESVSFIKDQLSFKLIIAGEFYSDEDKYRKMISELGIENNVILKSDYIPTDKVKYYFSATDVVVLPYKSATQSGITMMAKNFCKPVIATKVGGLSEIVKDGINGYLVEPNNPKLLSEAILKFYENNKEKVFSENLVMEKEEFGWKKFLEKFIDFVKTDQR